MPYSTAPTLGGGKQGLQLCHLTRPRQVGNDKRGNANLADREIFLGRKSGVSPYVHDSITDASFDVSSFPWGRVRHVVGITYSSRTANVLAVFSSHTRNPVPQKWCF